MSFIFKPIHVTNKQIGVQGVHHSISSRWVTRKSVHPPTCHGTEEVHCVTTDGENGHRHSTVGVNKLWSDVEINQTFENRSLSCFAKSRTNI